VTYFSKVLVHKSLWAIS